MPCRIAGIGEARRTARFWIAWVSGRCVGHRRDRRAAALLFSREGGSPVWAPAFAGEQARFVLAVRTAQIPPPRRRPGPKWEGLSKDGSARLLRPFQLGPGLRRGGVCRGGALTLPAPGPHHASAASTPMSLGKKPSCAVRSVSSAMTSSRSGRSKIRRLPPVRPSGSASTSAACAAPRKSSSA